MTCFARTRLVPAVLQDAEVQTAWEPERFVPAPFSEYRILVEVMHEGRVVLRQALPPATGMSSMDPDLLRRDFPIHGVAPVSRATGPVPPPSAPASDAPYPAWMQAAASFFNRDWTARLCVLHAPSGCVVCLGMQSDQGADVGPMEEPEGTPPAAGLRFSWWLRTPFPHDAVIEEIEEGLPMQVDGIPGDPDSDDWLLNWDPVLGRDVAQTKGLTVMLEANLTLTPGGPNAAVEVWEWDYCRVEAEPVLTYSGSDDFQYNNWSDERHHHTDHMLHAFLHAAAHVA
jgi:hypothetical protein